MKTKSSPQLVLFIACTLAVTFHARAGSANWNLDPTSGDWNSDANWTPATVPNGRTDIATFALSNMTNVSLSGDTQVDSIVFSPGAARYAITTAPPSHALTISGGGIINNSGFNQNLGCNAGSKITLEHDATLGFIMVTCNGGNGTMNPATLAFHDKSNAGSATIVSNPSEIGGFGATIIFKDNSAAGHATITANGNTGNGLPGNVHFRDGSNAAHATLIANPGTTYGGSIYLDGAEGSSAAEATITAKAGSNGAPGGNIYLWYDTRGGRARINVEGNSIFDISNRSDSGVAIGSLEGGGKVYLGSHDLAVGRIPGLYTYFAGTIQDGGVGGGTGGSLTMSGPGNFTLQTANIYTGGTRVLGGTLTVVNGSGSATGPNAVRVLGGTLTGFGAIDGMVIVGKGNGSGAFLNPSTGNFGTAEILTIRKSLRLEADASYTFTLNSDNGTTHNVSANGTAIRDATIVLDDLGNSALSVGTVLTAIDNTSATPIMGAFNNLADASTVTVGSNTFQANYEGGDGNDLTLTVVP